MSASVQVRGSQTPTFSHVPAAVRSRGPEVVALAAKAGLILDPWQSLVLGDALGVRADDKWAAFEVGLVVPRQNGKGSILEALMLASLFLFHDKLTIYSAHEFKTAQEMFRRIRFLVEDCPEFAAQVKRIVQSTNESGIELTSGERLRFLARSGGAGRGFSSAKLILDEAYDLPSLMMAAILPTMATAPNPQVWYASSAGRPDSEHLRSVRDRGREGSSPDLAYLEWCARQAVPSPDDVEEQANANPSAGLRISFEYIAREREALRSSESEFLRERMGVWDDPSTGSVIPAAVWALLVDRTSSMLDPVSLAVDTSPDRKWSTIAAAGLREDGRKHVEIVDRRAGTAWVAGRVAEVAAKWDIVEVTVDGGSAALSLVPEFEDKGLGVQVTSAGDYAAGCGAFYDAAHQDDLRHRDQPDLSVALAGAGTRPLREAWAWTSRTSTTDISPVVASTLALWAHIKSMDISNNVW